MSVVRGRLVLPTKRRQMRRERPSIMVNQIDTAKLTTLLYWKNVEVGSDARPEGEAMVVVNTPKGLATICNEGVGWWKNDEDKYLVGGYIGYSNPTYYITEDELLSCVSSEQVDLAEFIRSFGSRLEVNFDLWYNQVKDTDQSIMSVGQGIIKERKLV
jgi:hypothetical protein